MANFQDHKVTVNHLLGVIPESLLSQLSDLTKVDHYSKILQGRKMFYLLLYGILENDRLSQRTLEDTFNDSIFKTLFALDPQETVCRSSISERLGKIDSSYFGQIYECIYEQFSECYSDRERQQYNLIRVDSTIVYDVSNRLIEGFNHNQHPNKVAKFSVAFDGVLPCAAELFAVMSDKRRDVRTSICWIGGYNHRVICGTLVASRSPSLHVQKRTVSMWNWNRCSPTM